MGISTDFYLSAAFRDIDFWDKAVDKPVNVVFTEFPLSNHFINLIIINYNRFLYRIRPCVFKKH